jgi:Flp pilus assembly protein TadG
VTLELAVAVPGLLLLGALLVVAGRLAVAQTSVDAAAADAARTASLARTPAEAVAQATAGAGATLAAQGLRCSGTAVDVDASGFAVPAGSPAQVSVTVSCDVTLADLAVPGLPGVREMTATVHSPLDTYRQR